MFDLKNSIILLFSYITLVLGIANVQYVEDNLLDFNPVFFIMFGIAILMGLLFTGPLLKQGVRISMFLFLGFWAIVYGIVWASYWRIDEPLSLDILLIQFILLEVGAGLAYDAGHNVGRIEHTLDGLAVATYPNRMLDIQAATDRIRDELNRSRRYHHPLSLLVFKLDNLYWKHPWRQTEPLQKDILTRFTSARIGQMISDLSRQTDIIIRDTEGQFILLCPETEDEDLPKMADRIRGVVADKVGVSLLWGSSSFPEEALTFDDLLHSAENRLPLNRLSEPLDDVPTSDAES